MKKAFIALLISLGTLPAIAQETSAFDDYPEASSSNSAEGRDLSFTSKNGHEVLPKAGDWALGIDALPFLYQLGNTFNGTNNSEYISFDKTERSLPTATIYGKMMVRDDFAYRASLDIFASSNVSKQRIDDDNSSDPDDYLFDKTTSSGYGVTLSFGLENRRGRGRVQGIYGAEVYVHYMSDLTQKRDYANEITVSNQAPSSNMLFNSLGPGGTNTVPTPALAYRVTKVNRSDDFEAGVRGFIGVEYFFAPQMSIGGEFYLGAGYGITGAESVTAEGFDGNTNEVREYVNISESTTSLNIGTGNAGGAINLLFYF